MSLKFGEAVRAIVGEAKSPISPSQIKDRMKVAYPEFYQTEAARIGIEKGNYTSFDHALLNPIYALVTRSSDFVIDRTHKPLLVSLASENPEDAAPEENYEAELGLVYVLSTGLFTDKNQAIVKIGHTTQTLESRISQLYTTGTPFQFKELHSWRVRNYMELEQALHRLLAPFRISKAREFFTASALPFVEAIVKTHNEIQSQQV
jgi:hypothetical protein